MNDPQNETTQRGTREDINRYGRISWGNIYIYKYIHIESIKKNTEIKFQEVEGTYNEEKSESLRLITAMQQEFVGRDYIPEAPLQTILSQEFCRSQPVKEEDEYEGAIMEVERLLSIPTATPNDDIWDKEYKDQLMGNDTEDGNYEQVNPNNYEREDPYHYEEVDLGHVGNSSMIQFRPTPHQSQINLSSMRRTLYDEDITNISTWTEDEDLRSGLVFTNKEAVQDALKVFSLKRHVDYRVTRSERSS
ncbi:uncharacterized protein G2W53_018506 [Senna tora]|uniref:Uncharacterized protein n=1 Tax=Senna tora TaxID=362788 RepID=A0A834TSN3_9FABA|nr:uncharacterized protein G2W53_018506 [Senna tora]